MLFNSQVITDKIPAVTHVDKTSRIQSINKDCGIIFDVLKVFQDRGNIPVLMNTSFNRGGEPIVENPEDAINCLLHTSIDALYFNNYKLVRK